MAKGKVLVTGCAGFIGSHVVDSLLKNNCLVVGVDNFNAYYDPKIKENNLEEAEKNRFFKLYREDILNFEKLRKIFDFEKPQKVIHLAARAGVRPSIVDPILYSRVNVLGTVNILKLSVDFGVKQFIFASSSSVYGNSKRLPFKEDDPCVDIISPYGASKRAAEFWVESFYKIYGLKSVILRFFTVYGPRGRPDMAPALFTKAILEDRSINQFGDGSSSRDYTYIDDIVGGITKVLDKDLDFEIINLGNNHPVLLTDFIKILEKITDKKPNIEQTTGQQGDMTNTWANIKKAGDILGWTSRIDLNKGAQKYISWFNQDKNV